MKQKRDEDLHVVYIITKLELGGAQKVCLALADYFTQQKEFSATLITGDGGYLTDKIRNHSDLAKILTVIPELRRELSFSVLRELKAFFKLFFLLRNIKKKYKHVLVHTHSTKAGVIGRWAAWLARIPLRVHTIHGYAFHNFQPIIAWSILVAIEYLTTLITTHFVCVSEKDRETGIRYFSRFKEKSSLIRAAVEDHFFHQKHYLEEKKNLLSPKNTLTRKHAESETVQTRQEERSYYYGAITQEKNYANNWYIIGTVACFKPQKNLIDLLKAFHQLYESAPIELKKKLILHIIGDGPQKNALIAWVTAHQLASHVRFLGWQDNVGQWMNQWKIFALSSLWEGLPCAIIEARLHKLPVVAYDSGGIAEVVKDQLNGALIQPGNWQQLAQELQALVMHENKYRRLADFNDQLECFTYKSMRTEHKKLYRDLMHP